MKYQIKINVQLPDGSFGYLPIVYHTEKGMQTVEKESKKECHMWAEYILPGIVRVCEVENG